ncbi:MAG: hypothetical protein IPG94_07500 [Kineosporiaceae bacterium]|nr:hypothetical protein [Kineosporiaceae bacterium]
MPRDPGRPAVLGCRRDRHRLRSPRHAGRLPQRGAVDQRRLELLAVRQHGFDAAFKAFQASIGVDAQKKSARAISDILQRDTPLIVPYFYQYLAAHSKKFAGMATTALGQVDVARRVWSPAGSAA